MRPTNIAVSITNKACLIRSRRPHEQPRASLVVLVAYGMTLFANATAIIVFLLKCYYFHDIKSAFGCDHK